MSQPSRSREIARSMHRVLRVTCFACGLTLRPDEAHEYGDPFDPSPCRPYISPNISTSEAVAFRSVFP
jgi:hypothetical protein